MREGKPESSYLFKAGIQVIEQPACYKQMSFRIKMCDVQILTYENPGADAGENYGRTKNDEKMREVIAVEEIINFR